jgi:hypothetical protein
MGGGMMMPMGGGMGGGMPMGGNIPWNLIHCIYLIKLKGF